MSETSEVLETVFSATEFLIAVLDRDLNFVRVNRAYATKEARSPEWFVGKNHFALYPHPENEAIFRRVIETGEPYAVDAKPFEYPDHPEFGVTYWNWSLQPVRGGGGAVSGIILTLVEVTERERAVAALRTSEARYRALFENAPVSLWEEDFSEVKRAIDALRAAGVGDLRRYFAERPDVVARLAALIRVENVNDATVALYGAAGKAQLLEGLAPYCLDESYRVLAEELAALAEGPQRFQSEIETRTLAGETRTVSLSVVVAPGAELSWDRVVVSVVDITARKRAEADRERLVAELQESLARVRTLTGLLPICASCKKIRDDNGYWSQVERYLSEHTAVTFTHGICPECFQRLYPEAEPPAASARRPPPDG